LRESTGSVADVGTTVILRVRWLTPHPWPVKNKPSSNCSDRRPENRRAFLDHVCAGAPEVRQRVEELLLADERAGSFLERQLLISTADQMYTTSPSPEINPGRFEPGQVIANRFALPSWALVQALSYDEN
jgi:hypothetical protein